MESGAGKSSGTEFSGRIRTLDFQSQSKLSVLNKGGNNNKRKIGVDDDVEVRKKKKRKSGKEVLLSSFERLGKNTRNRLYGDEASAGWPDLERSQSGLIRKLGGSSGFNNISFNVDGSDNVFRIPKRPRDSVGRKKTDNNKIFSPLGQSSSRVGGSDQTAELSDACKKMDGNQVSKRLGLSGGKARLPNLMSKVVSDSTGKVVSPKVRGRSGRSDDLVENSKSRVRSARHAKEEDGHLIVNNSVASSRQLRSNHRKRKDLASDSESLAKNVEPLAVSPIRMCDDSREEDEENLERNAARMLSSRFDPCCTGFSSKSRSSGLPSPNGLSLFTPYHEDFVSRRVGIDSESADASSRVLRPRTQHKEEGQSRKRRHFYEILSMDLDAYWVLKRRIKVFWPLDESWYYGIIIDYDSKRQLHHIKYDDRDEEWINLQNERFKVLLLPSEVPHNCKKEIKRAALGNKHDDKEKRDETYDDNSLIGSCKDTEPIISWLARSSHRIKSSLGISKRHKASNLSPNMVGSPERGMKKLSCNSVLTDRFNDICGGEKSALEDTSGSTDGKLHVVYVRRRFRTKEDRLFNALKVNNACGSASVSDSYPPPIIHGFHASRGYGVSLGYMESEGILWSVDESGFLKWSIPLVESKKLRLELGSPLTVLGFNFEAESSWFLHALLLLHYGTVTTAWPKVHLEMLFVDSTVGMRFLLYEGCLKQAVAFFILVLTLFNQPSEQGKYIDVQIPVTSIRLRLSCVGDLRKQVVFAFYSFSKLKYSKWLYLDCKLQRHCLFTKKLPVSDCTYDNIRALEGGSNQLATNSSCWESSAVKGIPNKSMQENMTCGVAVNQVSSNSDARHGKLPFVLSSAAAPTFFLSLHLKLLMENSVVSVSLRDQGSVCSLEHSEKAGYSIVDGCNLSERSKGGPISVPNSQSGKLNIAETSPCCRDLGENTVDGIVQSQKSGFRNPELEECGTAPQSLFLKDHVSVRMPDASCSTGLSVEIPSLDQGVRPFVVKTSSAAQSADSSSNMRDNIVHRPNPTGPRNIWHRHRNSSSGLFGSISRVWPDGKADFIGNGPKKPRTQVQYTLPCGGFDFSPKHQMHNRRGFPYQRIRRAPEKRIADGARNCQRNLDLLACDANVLITIGDRGWRQRGARVVLEFADHDEWRLAVKLSGTTKYSYKAHQFVQPGSTNRYTHAMMWKGGKDWVLEFPDRSQWMLFKEMHEECYNRNLRAASVKNIPIPGVRLIEDSDDNGTEVPFVRSSPEYFRQVESDVDMALGPSHVLYDMDSDDEQWISEYHKSSHGNGSKCEEISEELFEKTMDMFEKAAYAQQRDHFTSDEIEEFMVGVGPMEAIKIIHEHWRFKRQRQGMPLIRHLQPPLWERYEKQVKEWEKAPSMEKPTMFAFCLKPRGLEMPNKGSKHRSHRKLSVSGHSHGVLSDQYGLHAFGRRPNGFAFGDERVMFQGNSHESSDASPLSQASTGVFSPHDAHGSGHFLLRNDWSEWNHRRQLNRNKSKKIGTFLSPNDAQLMPSYNQRTLEKRNGVNWWNVGLPQRYQSGVSARRGIEPLDASDLDEFRLRDASGAAQHALNMAKLKREKSQRLLYRADLAIHKAVVSLMTADAIKTSFDQSSSDG